MKRLHFLILGKFTSETSSPHYLDDLSSHTPFLLLSCWSRNKVELGDVGFTHESYNGEHTGLFLA